MLLSPKKIKHRKQQKGRRRQKSIATSGISVDYGDYGIRAMSNIWINSRQLESARVAISRSFNKVKGVKIYIRVFPDKPITSHGNESVMGAGKGALDHYVVAVKRGMILFEVEGVTEEMAKEAFRKAGHKLPIKTKFATKQIV